LNKVALIRNTRTLGIPSLTHLARIALEAGAHGITVHPRPDGRHIRAQDVHELSQLLAQWPAVEFNIEGNPEYGILDLASKVQAQQVTFVPDHPEAITSDHGWDLAQNKECLRAHITHAKSLGLRVSLFMNPDPSVMAQAAELGADRIELYTEPYARAYGSPQQAAECARYRQAALAAQQMGLAVNAGHDLNLQNLSAFLQAVPGVSEVSIGHALIADALEYGLAKTVSKYLAAMAQPVA